MEKAEPKFQIRIAKTEDASELRKIYAPYVENTAITFEYQVPTEAEFASRIENTLKRYPYLVAEQDGEILGYAYASPFKERAAYDWAVETSIYVKMDAKGKGIGKLLYQNIEEILKQQNILNVNACIAAPEINDAYLTDDSIQFHEKMGYQMVGRFHKVGYKFHRWYDMVWMEKYIGEHIEKQPNVIKFSEIRNLVP